MQQLVSEDLRHIHGANIVTPTLVAMIVGCGSGILGIHLLQTYEQDHELSSLHRYLLEGSIGAAIGILGGWGFILSA
ncbi:MAG TPA: hypothetical protein VFP93_02610 [Gammaproteobacteria bacterium]|nr:hypothetical protein [Gammaproteobacteria bacterium]